MSDLDQYLARYFVNAEQFAAMCELPHREISNLIRDRLIPKPSYVVADSHVTSHVFGKMRAEGAIDGEYFHPANRVWVVVARKVVDEVGARAAHDELKKRFSQNLIRALGELNDSIWRLRDSFADDGSVIDDGLRARVDSMWVHFLEGTFGLCVANPSSEAAIARKEVLQEKLTQLSDNGSRKSFSVEEARTVLELIEAYSEAAMPFSPIEYARSSRKRLVEDLVARIKSQGSDEDRRAST
jgi:hypothetical protein